VGTIRRLSWRLYPVCIRLAEARGVHAPWLADRSPYVAKLRTRSCVWCQARMYESLISLPTISAASGLIAQGYKCCVEWSDEGQLLPQGRASLAAVIARRSLCCT
jgi:hypothetical protein